MWPRGTDLDAALDDLVVGRGVARGRHELELEGRNVTEEFRRALARNGYREMTVREAPIEAGQRIPAFRLRNGIAEFGWIRWEIFTPKSRRKLFASDRRDPGSGEWSVQINLGSPETIWANAALASTHDVDVVVPAAP